MANQSHGIGCTFQLGFGGSSAGVFILKVQEGSPAAAAGVQSGDRSNKPPNPNLNPNSS
jgi:S1-C subfamily serine protease